MERYINKDFPKFNLDLICRLWYNILGTYSTRRAPSTVAVASHLTEGSEDFFFSLQFRWREVVTMYITLVELLMILSLVIALAEYFNNRRDK